MIIKKLTPIFLFWVLFIFVVIKIPYPQSITQENSLDLFLFFSTLFSSLAFTINLLLRNFLLSFSITLGLIFILILKALDMLNLVTILLTIISSGLLISYFRKTKRINLTKLPKISKLTHIQKQK